MKLEITFKNFSCKEVNVDCGCALALSMARGLILDNANIIRVVVINENDEIFGVADRK